MQLPYLTHKPIFDVLPSHRLSHFYDDPQPPLCYFQGCFTSEGLHLQLRAYEQPTPQSYFCFTLLSGKKLCFSKNVFPGKNDSSLDSFPVEGENLIGHYWGTELFVPRSLCKSPLAAIVGLFHGNSPLCFLSESTEENQPYPMVRITPASHPEPSSAETPAKNQ